MRLDPHFGMLPERAFRKIGGRMTYEGGGKDSSPPPAPDYRGAAIEQSAATKEIATQQNFANRPNQYTPWGNTTWSQGWGQDPATGQAVTTWNQSVNLTPQAQGALDSQLAMMRGRSDLANSTMGRVQADVAQPWNYSQFTPRAGGNLKAPTLDTSAPEQTTKLFTPEAFSKDRDSYIAAQRQFMRPYQDRKQAALDTKLSNQGITAGSEAYKAAQMEMGDQLARDDLQAISSGQAQQLAMMAAQRSNEAQAFGQDVTSQQTQNAALQNQQSADVSGANFINNLRQQQIAEEAQRRGMSLNEMNALVSGQQVQTPQMPGFVTAQAGQAPQFLQAAMAQGQNQMDAWNAQQAQNQGMMSGLFGLGGTLASAYMGMPGGMMGGRLFG